MTTHMCSSCGERPAKFRSPSKKGKMKADRDHDLCIPCAASHIDISHANLMVMKERDAAVARAEGAIHTIVTLLRVHAFSEELEESMWDWLQLNAVNGTTLQIKGETIFPPPTPTGIDLSTPDL